MNVIKNKMGFISFICGVLAVFSTSYVYFSNEMTDGLSETPTVLVDLIVYLTKKESMSHTLEPSLTSLTGDLTDDIKRNFVLPISEGFIVFAFILAVIGKFRNENSFYAAIGVLGAVSATSVIDVRLFFLCSIAILFAILCVNKVKEYNQTLQRTSR